MNFSFCSTTTNIQMKTLTTLLLSSFFYFLVQPITAQDYNHTLTTEALQEDLAIMKKHLETVHPGLYCYTTKAELDQTFEDLQAKLNAPMTDLEFYRLLAPLQSQIQNGHTMVIPSEAWSQFKMKEAPLFPFQVYWNNDQLYILKNLSEDLSIPLGTQIVSINGQSTSDIVDQLLMSITRDGANTTYPIYLMSQGFAQWFADIIATPDQFILELIYPREKHTQTKRIQGLGHAVQAGYHLQRYQEDLVPWYLIEDTRRLSLRIEGDQATLTIPTFDSGAKSENGKKYKQFYKWAFAKIKSTGVKHLILDMRDNGGGDPRPQLALLHHLIDEPLRIHKRSYAITRDIPNPEYYPNDKVKSLNFLAKLALKKEGDIYLENGNFFAKLAGAPSRRPVKPSKNLYQGNLYVLINGGSFSATGEAAGILKDRNRGIFIGEEAGGSDSQNTSGRMPMLELPHSGVRVRLGLMSFELNVQSTNDGRGVLVDHEVRNTIEEELAGKDAIMEFVNEMIENN